MKWSPCRVRSRSRCRERGSVHGRQVAEVPGRPHLLEIGPLGCQRIIHREVSRLRTRPKATGENQEMLFVPHPPKLPQGMPRGAPGCWRLLERGAAEAALLAGPGAGGSSGAAAAAASNTPEPARGSLLFQRPSSALS